MVAGSGFSGAPGLAPELRFNDAMRIRLHEAGRIAAALQKRGIDCTIAAGIHPSDGQPELKHRALAAFFAPYGIAPERLIPIEGAANSRQEVIAFSRLPGCKILISEAYHLPRLMLLARKYRLDAVPAPAGNIEGPFGGSPLDFLPNAESFAHTERAVYEYLGIAEAFLLPATK